MCPDLSVLPVGICLASTRQQLIADGVDVTAYYYAGGVLVARRELTADDFTAIHHLREPLRDKESLSVSSKRLPILSHAPLKGESSFSCWCTRTCCKNADGMVLVGVQVESEPSVKRHGLEVVCKRGVERYARLLSHMPDKRAVMLIATSVGTYQITSYQIGLDTRLFRMTFQRVDRGCLCIIGRVLTPASKMDLFGYMKICPVHRLTYNPQHAKFGRSTAAEYLGFTSAAKMCYAATIWN